MSPECRGTHRYFVADVVQVGEIVGKVIIIAMCTACGETKVSEHFVNTKKEK